jgi:dTMP kinase
MATTSGTVIASPESGDPDRAQREKGRRAARSDRPASGRSRTIVLLGIDGVGKTTTAQALVRAQRERNAPAALLRNRAGRRWLRRASARFGLEPPVCWADRFETVVRTVNVLVSELRAARGSGTVIMDRHLICQLVLRKVAGLPEGRLLPQVALASLRAKTVVVLDVPAEVAYERVRARAEDLETLDFLRAGRAAYLQLAATRGWAVIDATGTTEAIAAHIERVAGR